MVYTMKVVDRPMGSMHERKSVDNEVLLAGSNPRPESGTGPPMLDTLTDMKKPDGLHLSHLSGHIQDDGGVSVDRAEANFAELNREFSRLSLENRDLSRVASQAS